MAISFVCAALLLALTDAAATTVSLSTAVIVGCKAYSTLDAAERLCDESADLLRPPQKLAPMRFVLLSQALT